MAPFPNKAIAGRNLNGPLAFAPWAKVARVPSKPQLKGDATRVRPRSTEEKVGAARLFAHYRIDDAQSVTEVALSHPAIWGAAQVYERERPCAQDASVQSATQTSAASMANDNPARLPEEIRGIESAEKGDVPCRRASE